MSSTRSHSTRPFSGAVAPVGHMLGNGLFSFGKSRLPIPNKPKTRHRRAFLSVAPIPFAPLVDAHVFQPPPPYSAHPDDPAALPVPHNTPEATPAATGGLALCTAAVGYARPVGLGLEGVEKGDGERFDGLGRLSGGFRASLRGGDTGETLREQVHRMLTEHAKRRRTRMREQPERHQDVFYASVEVQACDQLASSLSSVKIRFRRKSAASSAPRQRGWDWLRRGTISSELKRAASLERRASLGETTTTTATGWRV